MKTCGTKGHSSECLCDVIVPATSSINITDGVHGMWMGKQLCEIQGYNAPWTDGKILDYFTDLCTFYDRWAELQEKPFNHQNPAHERMVELLRQGVKNSIIRETVFTEFGIDYSRSAVSHTKRRLGLST